MRTLVLLLAGAAMALPPASASAAAPMTWTDLKARPRPTADATIVYGRDPSQRIDLWRPKGAGPFPVVLMVHGGCWTTGIADRTLMDWAAADLRASGLAVWNIDYRGVDRPGGGYPGTFLDVAAAADRLRTEATRYGLDLNRLVAVGHSAGGHLALWLAARPRLPTTGPLHSRKPLPIGQVVSLGGLPDLEATAASPDNGCGTDVVAQLTGPPTPTHRDVFADTSVPRLLPIGSRQHLIQGDRDRIIPDRLAAGYAAKARAAGDTVTLTHVADTGHVELIAPGTPAWTEAKARILAALR